ncbi:MAG: hypothetical protein K2K98_05115 [Muribaculaceae bacterium]|nr:hypothetical protein [Muribaculaceae bacterium]
MKLELKGYIIIISALSYISLASAESRNFADNIMPDTIDYNRTRLFLEAPQLSIKYSSLSYCAEGFAIGYPIISPSGEKSSLWVDDIRMHHLESMYETDIDQELWNTFNQDFVGSRCYIKNGLYYRFDRFRDGLIIYYEAVPKEMRNVADNIMKSVKTRPQKSDDNPLDRNKRTEYDMDNNKLIRKNTP